MESPDKINDPFFQLSKKSQEKDLELQELQKKYRHLEFTSKQELSKLESMYESEKSRAEMLEKSLRENNALKRASELEEEVLTLREEINRLKTPANHADGDLDSDSELLKKKYAHLVEENEALEARLKQMKDLAIAAIGEKDSLIENLREEINEMKALREKQIETSCAEIKELQEKIYSLEKSRPTQTRALEEATEKYQEAETERVELREKFAVLISNLEVQNSQNEAKIEALQNELHEKNLEKEKIKFQLTNNSDVKTNLLAELQIAEEKIAKHDEAVSELEKKFNQKEKILMAEMKENESKIEEAEHLIQIVADLKETNKKLEGELLEEKTTNRNKLQQLEDSLAHSESIRDSQLKAKITLEGENKRLLDQNHALKEKIALEEKQLMENRAKMEEIDHQIEEKIKEIEEKHNTEKQALEIELKRLQNIEQQMVSRRETIRQSIAKSLSIFFEGSEKAGALSSELSELLEKDVTSVSISENDERIVELEEKVEELEDKIEDMKHNHSKEIAGLKQQHEQELKNLQANTPKKETVVIKEKDDNILATVETLKAENVKLEMTLKTTRKQWEDEVAFLKEENNLTEIMAAEARVKAADVCTNMDYYRMKYKQTLKLLEGK